MGVRVCGGSRGCGPSHSGGVRVGGGGSRGCGPSHRWWGFSWLVGACRSSWDGASLWWAWGCRSRPSALWAGVRGVVEKAMVDVAHPSGCATSAAWWWASLSSLVVPGVLGIRCRESRYRGGTPEWACHLSRLVVGVVVGVCICWLHCSCRCRGRGTHLVSCIVVVAVAEAWDSGGWRRAVGGAGWWWLRARDVWHGLCQRFPIWQVPKW